MNKTVNGTTTQFLYDGFNPVQELNGAAPPSPTANLLTGLSIDEYLTRTDTATGVTSTLLADALGSTIGLVASGGSIATSYTYQPFGATTAGGVSNSNPYQFTGRENDGTGLYFYRARYYSPTAQRFIAQDPIGVAGGDSNLYDYAWDNPLLFMDPLGLSASSIAWCLLKGGALGAGGALVVGGLAVGAATIGVPVIAVTAVLGGVAIAGSLALGVDINRQWAAGNWDGLAFDAGSLVGGSRVGGFGGRTIAEGINGEPSPPWSIRNEYRQLFDPSLGSIGDWLATGPNPGSAGGSAALGGAGAAS